MQFVLSKDKPMPELQIVVSSIGSVTEARQSKSKTLKRIPKSCVSLVESETPSYAQMILYSLEPFQAISECEEVLSASELRFKEDLQDIVERYSVVLRIKKNYDDIILEIEKFKNTVKEIETLLQLSECNTQKQKLIDNLKIAKANRNESIKQAIEITKELIEAKKRFEKFMINRIKHGWKVYSEQLYKTSITEYDLYQSISNSLADVRVRIDEANENKDKNDSTKEVEQTTNVNAEEIENPFESLKL